MANFNFDIRKRTTGQLQTGLGEKNLTSFDIEFLDDIPKAVAGLAKDLLRIAGAELPGATVSMPAENLLEVTVNGKQYEFSYADRIEYVTSNAILKDLNSLLEANQSGKRFFYYYDGADFGQEHGYFYAEKEWGIALLDYLENPPHVKREEFADQYGNRILNVELKDSSSERLVEYFCQVIDDF